MLNLKSLGLAIITASVLLGSQALASVPTSVLDQHTDSYFGDIHPEMRDRRIQANQTQYTKEWLAIREVLRNRISYGRVCYKDGYDYDVENYGGALIAITDAVFYVRHPELAGRKIKPNETRLTREWNSIWRSFPPDNC
jgi:hypothetical protein